MSKRSMTNEEIWTAALGQLQLQMTQATFDTWVKDSVLLSVDGDTYTIAVQNAFAKDWLENRLCPTIQRTLVGIVSRPDLKIEIVVEGNGTDPSPGDDNDPPAQPDPAEPIAVELVSFDPTLKGFVMVANYAARFWQPYLKTFGSPASPFELWVTLKAFAYDSSKDSWPSIETLADMCGDGQRYKILGRAERKNCKRIIGSLEVLEQQRIAYVKRSGQGRSRSYRFRVLEHLPLLTPRQVEQLSPRLQQAHKSWLLKCRLDYEEWNQLSFPSLTGQTD